MNGFGFIEYKDPMDARDVVPGKPKQLKFPTSLAVFAQVANV